MSRRFNRRATLIVVSLLVFAATATYVGWRSGGYPAALGAAHSSLMARSHDPPLTTYVRCLFGAPCGPMFDHAFADVEPFPFRVAMLSLVSLGGVVAGWRLRPKPKTYDSALATRDDVKDLRMPDWLTHKAAGTGILLGHHVKVPERGPMRRWTLRGWAPWAADRAPLVLPAGYGKRRELPSMAVFGTGRSGKSLLLTAQLIRWQGSSVSLDVKGELYRTTAGVKERQLRGRGGGVFVLSPEGRGHQFNAISELIAEADDLHTAATIIAAPHREKGDSRHFASKAAQALTAAFLAARLEKVPPFDLLFEVVLKGGLGSFVERVGQHRDPDVRLALNSFLDPHGGEDFELQRILSDKGLAASYSTMTERLGPFLRPNVRYLLRRSDFRAFELMERPHHVYVQFSEVDVEGNLAVYDLVMTALLRGMIRYADALQGEAPRVPVFMALDEIYKAPIAHLPGDLSTASGRHIVIALYCQTMAQLRGAYGPDGAETILGNCGVHMFYKTESLATAQYVSSLAHKTSQGDERRSRRQRLVPESPTISEGQQHREVLTPDEVILVGGENRELLVASVTGKPLMVLRRLDLRRVRRLQRLIARYPAPPIKVADGVLTPSHEAVLDLSCGKKKGESGTKEPQEVGTGEAKVKPEPVPAVRPAAHSEVLERLEGLLHTTGLGPTREGQAGKAAQPTLFVPDKVEPESSAPENLNAFTRAGLEAEAARRGAERAET